MSQAIKHDGKIDVRSTMLAAANEVREHHAKDFAKWLDEKEQQYGIEEWIFDGFDDYSGDRKYLRNTVENASKVMNREGERNSYDSIGFGATRAMLTKRMHTLDDIRKNKDLLSGKSEDISQRTKALSDELFSIIEEISAKKKIGDNQFTNNEFAEMRLQEALGKKDPVKWLEKEYDYKIEPELRKRIENFVEDVKKLPSKYFETKFNRPVKLDEFAVAVVPESTSEDIIRGLQDSGIDVRKYDSTPEGREQVALDAVRGRDDIRFRTEHEKTEQDEIERGKRGQLNQKEAEDLLSKMEANAEEAPDLELTQENWAEEFGEDGKVETPIGKVKIGENQFAKLLKKGREAQFGMIKPTLESPDVIIEEESNGNERNSSYLFIKTFNRNGDKIKYFASVTVEKDGLEVSISSHYVRKNKVLSSMMGGNILYKKESLTPNSSDRRLAEHRNDVPDLLPTQGDNDSLSSVAKIINDFKNPVMESENLSKEASLHEEDMHHAKDAVDNLASKLNISGRVEALTSTDGLEGRKAKAKGWYDVDTGKITVVLPNHGSVDDVMETLLHEGVAHHGLRKMFGDGFDAFLDDVYKNADEDIKAKIKHEALNIIAGRKQRKLYKEQRGGKEWQDAVREATDEHIASLAEDADFERAMKQGWWSRIKNFFMDMLRKVGLNLKKAITDNELRYVLWRSYRNLANSKEETTFERAEDIDRQIKLKVGNFSESKKAKGQEPVRYRDVEEHTEDAIDKYDSGAPSFKEQITDALIKTANAHKESIRLKTDAMRAINGVASDLRKAMSVQREYGC